MKFSDVTPIPPLLELKDISADYGSVKALRELNLKILPGEIHAVVGEHGAGKSTLAKILISMLKPNGGTVLFDGEPVKAKNIKESMNLGIRMVFQRLQLNDGLSVAENLFLNNKEVFQIPFQRYSSKKVQHLAQVFFEENGIDLNPAMQVGKLELSEKALLAVLRNLYTPPRLLILDETLEKLSSAGLECVIGWLKKLKQMGSAVLYITHRIDDLYVLADRVSILRRGEVLLSEDIGELDKINLIKLAYTQFDVLDKKNRQVEEFNRLLKYNDAVLKELPLSLIVTNFANQIKLMNEVAQKMFGYNSCPDKDLEELLGDNLHIMTLINKAVKEKEQKTWINIPLHIGPVSYQTNLMLYPIIEDESHIGNMVIIEDVTERESLRDKLILSEKLAGIGILAAGVAHEINNPLGVISNYLETLRKNKISDQNRNEVINYLFEQIDYITHVISNLVTFADDSDNQTTSCDVREETEKIIRLIRLNGDYKNIQINFNPGQEKMIAQIAKSDLRQIMLNLFKNSFEVMKAGGIISINIDSVFPAGTEKIRIRFSDTGPGIEFSEPNDVFLPFTTNKSGVGNYGLGLSLCFTLLKRCNGQISVKNLPARGCEFEILLPWAH